MIAIGELLAEMERAAEAEYAPILRATERSRFREIVRRAAPRRILEIGTAIGYSALVALSESAADTVVVTLEKDPVMVKRAAAFFARSPFAPRIILRQGDARELLPALAPGFDFVFIDAAKGQYPDYWEMIQPLLAAKASVAADNVLFQGMVEGNPWVPHRYRTLVYRLREYLALVRATPRYRTEIYPEGDGLAVSWRNQDT